MNLYDYYALRDYGVAGQIGLEETPQQFVAKLVEVFREVRRVLHDSGTCWVNLGDSYAGSWGAQSREHSGKHVNSVSVNQVKAANRKKSGTAWRRWPATLWARQGRAIHTRIRVINNKGHRRKLRHHQRVQDARVSLRVVRANEVCSMDAHGLRADASNCTSCKAGS